MIVFPFSSNEKINTNRNKLHQTKVFLIFFQLVYKNSVFIPPCFKGMQTTGIFA